MNPSAQSENMWENFLQHNHHQQYSSHHMASHHQDSPIHHHHTHHDLLMDSLNLVSGEDDLVAGMINDTDTARNTHNHHHDDDFVVADLINTHALTNNTASSSNSLSADEHTVQIGANLGNKLNSINSNMVRNQKINHNPLYYSIFWRLE